jgi:hypothetical protein
MKQLFFGVLALCVFSCGSDKKNMQVSGSILGLKKGTIYLKKANDSMIVIVDSTKIGDDYKFQLSAEMDEPEAFYLELDKTVNKENRITFMGYEGLTTINTTLKNFGYDAQIKGSKDQEVLENYLKMMSRFKDQNLEFLKSNLDAQIKKDTLAYLVSSKKMNNQTKRKYLYTANFALANKSSIVAPYLALTEIYDAKLSLLDTINVSLTKDVKASKYGEALDGYIKALKEEDTK